MGGPGSGRKAAPKRSLKLALEELQGDIPDLLDRLTEIAKGRLVWCPECGATITKCPECGAAIVARVPDLEACKYLVDRILGRPAQHVEVDVTHRVELSAGQCAEILQRGRREHDVFLLPPGGDDARDQAAGPEDGDGRPAA